MRHWFPVLFVCNLCLWSMGNGLLPLMPVYILERGASPAMAGAALACAYGALAASNLLTGRLAGALRSRKGLLVIAGLLAAPPTALLGLADQFWQITGLLAVVWFLAGLAAAMVHVLTGVYSEPGRRGRSFGLMMLAMPLGALIGAPTLGLLAEQYGYVTMFGCLAVLSLAWPLLALVGLPHDRSAPIPAAPAAAHGAQGTPITGTTVPMLLAMTVLAAITTFVGRLATSLAMRALHFDVAAIGGAMAVGALAALPLLPLIGILSDRIGRRSLLGAAYLLGGCGTLTLAFAQSLALFWLASALLSIAVTTSSALTSALAADLLPPHVLTRVLPRITAMGWIAAVIGFAGGGLLIERLGLLIVAGGALALAVSATGLLYRLPDSGRRSASLEAAPRFQERPGAG
jgi:MFS family permease